MSSRRKAVAASPGTTPESAEPSPDQKRELVERAIETAEKLAESQLEMARLFVDRGKPEIARRRLTEVVDQFGRSEAAKQARKMLRQL